MMVVSGKVGSLDYKKEVKQKFFRISFLKIFVKDILLIFIKLRLRNLILPHK